MTEIFVGGEEKWTNKGTEKQYASCSITQCNLSYSMLVPNFKIISQTVSEKL